MKNFLIIGGSSGIGRALVSQLTAQGHQVFATYNTVQDGLDNSATYFHHDVMGGALDESHLPDSLDGFAYCPGSIELKPFKRVSADALAQDFQLHVGGAVATLQAVLPRLKKSESASVVFFSTVAVQSGFNFHSQVSTCKGALEGLTRALAAEFAPSMRVNAIAPSITHTKLAGKLLSTEAKVEANAQRHPLKKIGTPDDIAAMANFLLSDQASWITGQILTADGGISTLRV